jgi:hypothetical protein
VTIKERIMTSKSNHKHSFDIKINADFIKSEDAKKLPDTCAYAFSQGGQLLCCKTIKPKETVTLSIPVAKKSASIRLLIGPTIDENKVDAAELLRRGAINKMLRVDKNLILDIPIFPPSWLCWLRSFCLVKGTMLKRTYIDGKPVDMPVCNAHVDIYEVDSIPNIIGNLSIDFLEKIRDQLDGFPLTGPFPPIDPLLPAQPELPFTEPAVPAVKEFKLAAQQIGINRDIEQFRNSLLQNVELLRPVIWPYFCNIFGFSIYKQKVASAVTDDCGRFQTVFFSGCNNPDKPDLYFKATQKLFGLFNIVIYEPKPVSCYTRWNYECGSEVKLYTNSPWAKVCSPCSPVIAGNNWVLVRAIGNLPLSRIHGTSTALSATTNNTNIGLYNESASKDRPFGGFLRLRIEFDNSIRENLGVKYYQVSYRRVNSDSLLPLTEFLPLTGEIHRHFSQEIPHVPGDEGEHPDTHLVEEVYPLGPKTINGTANLFEIPSADPEDGQWTIPDLTEDVMNAKFPTASLVTPDLSGKYQLRIELYDADGAKVKIDNIAGETIHYVVPADEDPSAAVALYTDEATSLGLIKTDADGYKSFVMTLHIDNNKCTANISLPELNGVSANDCGVINYHDQSATVSIDFNALHPNGFATYTFSLVRGATDLNTLNLSGTATGVFTSNNPVSDLLSVNCPMAGFSAHLHVEAWATNGFGTIHSYDAGDHIGFALTPEE